MIFTKSATFTIICNSKYFKKLFPPNLIFGNPKLRKFGSTILNKTITFWHFLKEIYHRLIISYHGIIPDMIFAASCFYFKDCLSLFYIWGSFTISQSLFYRLWFKMVCSFCYCSVGLSVCWHRFSARLSRMLSTLQKYKSVMNMINFGSLIGVSFYSSSFRSLFWIFYEHVQAKVRGSQKFFHS